VFHGATGSEFQFGLHTQETLVAFSSAKMRCRRCQAVTYALPSLPLRAALHLYQSPFISQPQRSSTGRPWRLSWRAARAMSASLAPELMSVSGQPRQDTIGVALAGRPSIACGNVSEKS
jgi:hypothetical protein